MEPTNSEGERQDAASSGRTYAQYLIESQVAASKPDRQPKVSLGKARPPSINPSIVLMNPRRYGLFQTFATHGRLVGYKENDRYVTDDDGLWWATRRRGDWWFGYNGLLTTAQLLRLDPEARQAAITTTTEVETSDALIDVGHKLPWGRNVTQVLFALYQRTWVAGQAAFTVESGWLARRVWGAKRPPNWLKQLRQILEGLCRLHAARAVNDTRPQFDVSTGFLASAEWKGRQITIEIGPGFMGPLSGRTGDGKVWVTTDPESLSDVYKRGKVLRYFLPAELGPVATGLTVRQKGLIHTLLNEVTRRPYRRNWQNYRNAKVPNRSGRGKLSCPELETDAEYNAFNGNLRNHGCGYRPAMWLKKFPVNTTAVFLSVLGSVCELLELVVVGLPHDRETFLGLAEMQELAKTPEGNWRLDQTQIRIYTRSDWARRWARKFEWPDKENEPPKSPKPARTLSAEIVAIKAQMVLLKVSATKLAKGLRVGPRFVQLVLRGTKSCPAPLLEKMRDHLATIQQPEVGGTGKGSIFGDCKTNLDYALAYLRLGWSVVPFFIKGGDRIGRVKWRPYQKRLPTEKEIIEWWTDQPTDLINLVLGPRSNVLVIDSDGVHAAAALKKRLGSNVAIHPMAIGSGRPGRFHLFCQHPSVETSGSYSPWFKQDGEALEFKGMGGTVTLPPSRHPSGSRHRWVKGRSIEDLRLPPTPALITAEFVKRNAPPTISATPVSSRVNLDGIPMSSRTRVLLLRSNAERRGRWNKDAFEVACDLKGRGVEQSAAWELILSHFGPRDSASRDRLQRTVESAYSQDRQSARL